MNVCINDDGAAANANATSAEHANSSDHVESILVATTMPAPIAEAPLPSCTTASTSAAATTTTALGMDISIDNVGSGDTDDAINVIEDGGHVSTDEFGLSSTEISIHTIMSQSPIEEDSSHMDALHIQTFLVRADHDVNTLLLPAVSATITTQTDVSQPQPQSSEPTTDEQLADRAQAAAASASNALRSTFASPPSTEPPPVEPIDMNPIAYDASRSVVFNARQDIKIQALHTHPLAVAVSPDGREVTCKCGRVVRLNPPWYVLKFEQHIVSRNCSFLRAAAATATAAAKQLQSRRRTTTAKRRSGSSTDSRRQQATGKRPRTVLSGATATARAIALDGTASAAVVAGNDAASSTTNVVLAAVTAAATAEPATLQADLQATEQLPSSDDALTSYTDSHDLTAAVATAANAAAPSQAVVEATKATDQYALLSLREALASNFSFAADGTIDTPVAFIQDVNSNDDSAAAMLRVQFDACVTLQHHPHFRRVTPDGRIIECATCAKLIVLHAPWTLDRFVTHVADKLKPPRTKRRLSAAALDRQHHAARAAERSAVLLRHGGRNAATMLERHKQPSFPQPIDWRDAQARGVRPCPGLRADARLQAVVATAMHVTGGARPRHVIAHELFSARFAVAVTAPTTASAELEQSTAAVADAETPASPSDCRRYHTIASQLNANEQQQLHDAIEAEALWFIDKDAVTVRSLDCDGFVDVRKREFVCRRCVALESNARLRYAAQSAAKKQQTSHSNPLHRNFGVTSREILPLAGASSRDDDDIARLLQDLSLVDDSRSNVWLDAAALGLDNAFARHATLLGVVEGLVARTDKQRRGVGLQNMVYSDALDVFTQTLADVSPAACALFQQHLGGRTPQALGESKRKRKRKRTQIAPHDSVESLELSHEDVEQQSPQSPLHIAHVMDNATSALLPPSAVNGVLHSNRSSTSALAPPLSIHDIHHHNVDPSNADHDVVRDATSCPDAASLWQQTMPSSASSTIRVDAPQVVACTGLRDAKVALFVKTAVQVIGGSRPKYVIAKELFPDVFAQTKAVQIATLLTDAQKQTLHDAVYRECLWRVDKVGNCVRSLRCHRFVERPSTLPSPIPNATASAIQTANRSACRACRDLKAIPNFRSVLSRAKSPKVLDNVKYVPTSITGSDPFLHKLAKNASFRTLYQRVQQVVTRDAPPSDSAATMPSTLMPSTTPTTTVDRKVAVLWLTCARMGVLGAFRTHPVFEGLIESMVELKDKERRGVGKQNMHYARAFDAFMHTMAELSLPAFDVFAAHFCGRTLRSQNVQKRKSLTDACNRTAEAVETAEATAVEHTHQQLHTELPPHVMDVAQQQQQSQQHLLATDELLGGRQLTASDLEENQRFMDRMLDDVRLSVSHDIQLHEESVLRQQSQQLYDDQHASRQQQHRLQYQNQQQRSDASSDTGPALDSRTYLDDQGVLTTEI